MTDKEHFTTVAGFEAEAAHDKALAFAREQPGFDLPRWQVRNDFWVAAEIVETVYGYGLRYASSLQDWAIIYSAQSLGTLDKALAAAQEWANAEHNRYVFIRNHALANAGKVAVKVAEREATQAKAAAAQQAVQHSRGYHKAPWLPQPGVCEACDQARVAEGVK